MKRLVGCLPLLAVVALARCGDSNEPSPSITQVIDQVTGGGVPATLVRGDPPAGGTAGAQVFAPTAVVVGGSVQVQLAASGATFNTVYIQVAGTPDHYRINLPAAVTNVTAIVTVTQNLGINNFQLTFGLVTAAQHLLGTHQVSVVQVGTGDVQVSVNWDSPADVDLHVVEPGGEEIYYADPIATSGGELDLDSNADCASDGPRNENITWATPPMGTYTVRLDHYKNCTASETFYTVTVQRKNQAPLVFTGTFTGTGDQGGAGSGVLITTFTY